MALSASIVLLSVIIIAGCWQQIGTFVRSREI
jgi:hypothetical protein